MNGTAKIVSQVAPRNDATTVSVVNSLNLASNINGWTGTLDLADNAMIVQQREPDEHRRRAQSRLQRAHGLLERLHRNHLHLRRRRHPLPHHARLSQSGGSTFDGINTTTSDVLVKYTYYGDADLSGTVNGARLPPDRSGLRRPSHRLVQRRFQLRRRGQRLGLRADRQHIQSNRRHQAPRTVARSICRAVESHSACPRTSARAELLDRGYRCLARRRRNASAYANLISPMPPHEQHWAKRRPLQI